MAFTQVKAKVKLGNSRLEVYGATRAPGEVITFETAQELQAALSIYPNSLVPTDENGDPIAMESVNRIIDKLLKSGKIKEQKLKGVYDPKTDTGEQGPGLTSDEIRKFDFSKFVLAPITCYDFAGLQHFCNRLKLGRPSLATPLVDIYRTVEEYLEYILAERKRLDAEGSSIAGAVTEDKPSTEDDAVTTSQEADKEKSEEDSQVESEEDSQEEKKAT